MVDIGLTDLPKIGGEEGTCLPPPGPSLSTALRKYLVTWGRITDLKTWLQSFFLIYLIHFTFQSGI